jgi:hypothetical protein
MLKHWPLRPRRELRLAAIGKLGQRPLDLVPTLRTRIADRCDTRKSSTRFEPRHVALQTKLWNHVNLLPCIRTNVQSIGAPSVGCPACLHHYLRRSQSVSANEGRRILIA